MKTPKLTPRKEIHSVTSLTRSVKSLLEGSIGLVRVEGEIGGFTKAGSGHWYFTLKDKNAQLPCVMFSSNNRFVQIRPKTGMLVLVEGRLSVYEPRGAYQLVAQSMQERGQGKMREAFERLKAKLASEGLFDEARKRALPFFPKRIALVTSPSGAAVKDMIRVIQRRNEKVGLIVVPTIVQGEGAASAIVSALKRAETLQDVELIIVGRGGGGMEDLWAFNDETLAREIAACPIPVMSAVGHEVDFTIADFVADHRAATPSVAGEIAVPLLSDIEGALAKAGGRLARSMKAVFSEKKLRLHELEDKLATPERALSTKKQRLDELAYRLSSALPRRFSEQTRRINLLNERLLRRHPQAGFERKRARLARSKEKLNVMLRHLLPTRQQTLLSLRQRLVRVMNDRLARRKETIGKEAAKLDALSPLNVLKRGYSLTTDETGDIVQSIEAINPGQILKTYLAKGGFDAFVVKVWEDRRN